jgi:ABC-type multidrug transport system fused ATPase/permease subunit
MSKNDDEVLVRVEGVSKKFCRSLKKSLWYGVCDIASELNPFGRVERMPSAYKYLTTEDTECTEGEAKVRLAGQAGAEFSNPSASGLARGSENTSLIRAANNLRSSGDQTGSDSASAKIGEICGKNEGLRPGEFWAVRDVSFELRRGECLGLIGHNGAGKTTLLKMLNGLIKPDAGSITMRGRVGALIARGAGFNPILTGRSPRWSLAPRLRLSINGSVLGLTKSRSSAKIEFMAGCGCQNKCPLAIR